MDPRERFADRAKEYAKYRPSYPAEMLEELSVFPGLDPTIAVADIGSGTGIFSEGLLNYEANVYAIEPNPEMRAEAEERLSSHSRFKSLDGSAEQIPLPDGSVDLVTCAQSFHWFDPMKCRTEFARILKIKKWVALIWNVRNTDGTKFLRDYDELLQKFAPEYKGATHAQDDEEGIRTLYGSDDYNRFTYLNPQSLFWDELAGRAQSASYFPAPYHPNHEAAMVALREIFDKHKSGARVDFDYNTQLFLGEIKD